MLLVLNANKGDLLYIRRVFDWVVQTTLLVTAGCLRLWLRKFHIRSFLIKTVWNHFTLERTWIKDRGHFLATWDLLHSGILKTFTNVIRKDSAEGLHDDGVQRPNENALILTEEMTRLFCLAYSDVTWQVKVRFFMRSSKQELFAEIVHNPSKTLEEFVSGANQTEKTPGMRIAQLNYHMLTSNYTEFQAIDSDQLLETIRATARK